MLSDIQPIQLIELFKDGEKRLVRAGTPQEKHWRDAGFLAEGEEAPKPAAKPAKPRAKAKPKKTTEPVEDTVEDLNPESN